MFHLFVLFYFTYMLFSLFLYSACLFSFLPLQSEMVLFDHGAALMKARAQKRGERRKKGQMESVET